MALAPLLLSCHRRGHSELGVHWPHSLAGFLLSRRIMWCSGQHFTGQKAGLMCRGLDESIPPATGWPGSSAIPDPFSSPVFCPHKEAHEHSCSPGRM